MQEEIMQLWHEHLEEQRQEREKLEQQDTTLPKAVLAADKALERAAAAVNRAYTRRRQQVFELIKLKGGQEPDMKELVKKELEQVIKIVARNEQRRQGKIKSAIRIKKIRIAARTSTAAVMNWQKEQEILCRAFQLCVLTTVEKSRLEQYPLARKPGAESDLKRLERELEEIREAE